MPSLPRELRKQLENAVKKARRVAEKGARDALEGLAVPHQKPWPSMSKKEANLRSRLRAHGRQLGDRRDEKKGTQSVNHLASEVGYEHWHRMLFARFLAEGDLLIEPDSGVAASIDEVRELARERGGEWIELASTWAQRMLPQIFRSGDPVLEVSLSPETRQELESILEVLPRETFIADDSLGWVYQFWQAERKDEVNASGNKIGPDELPAVTQLFTEDYMVEFLLDNTLGAWHAGKVLAAKPMLADTAQSEEELRNAVALPDCPWKYLRFIQAKDGKWTPAAGIFDGWPRKAKELKCLDPCMGSGHFVVAMFARLVGLRMAEEELDEKSVVSAVIAENLFGLEIDPRCTQIAAFNLALAAWRRVGHCSLPSMNLACAGLAINAKEDEWVALASKDEQSREAMRQLWQLFAQAPLLGSLIDPRRVGGDLFTANFEKIRLLLERVLTVEEKNERAGELAVAAKGIVGAAAILSERFTLVGTNVPYLGQGNQSEDLKAYCGKNHADAKGDLATCFLDRCLASCRDGGSTAVVTPQNWLFLATYTPLRSRLLKEVEWNLLTWLGEHGFESSQAAGAFTALFVATRRQPKAQNALAAFDVSATRGENRIDARQKAMLLRTPSAEKGACFLLSQNRQLTNPGHVPTIRPNAVASLLSQYAQVHYGSKPGQTDRVVRYFWEVNPTDSAIWRFMESTPDATAPYSGKQRVCFTSAHIETCGIEEFGVRGADVWGKTGVVLSQMSELPTSLYLGQIFDNNTSVIAPNDHDNLPAIWAFMSSAEFRTEVRARNRKLDVDTKSMVAVPFDLSRWKMVAAKESQGGVPSPYSNSPAQWLYSGDLRAAGAELQTAVIRLLGYRWPRQSGSSFPNCPALGEDGLESHADSDGIVCLAAVKGKPTAADGLRALLESSYCAQWSPAKLGELLTHVGYGGKSLEEWIRDGFFAQHCDLFRQRPFIWQIWDGLKNGFSALVNYQRLVTPRGEGRKTLDKLVYSYLGDWIERQRGDQNKGVEGSDLRLAAAEHLKSELEKILHGVPPFDIFVRWKPLHQQPIGWEPDINDGVRINIRPFMVAKPLNSRGKNACILRVTPNIKWGKDGGKELEQSKEDFPWLWDWDEKSEDFAGRKTFDGNRWNDLHYSRAFKEDARRRHAEKKGKK